MAFSVIEMSAAFAPERRGHHWTPDEERFVKDNHYFMFKSLDYLYLDYALNLHVVPLEVGREARDIIVSNAV